jgi:hypothetical protein
MQEVGGSIPPGSTTLPDIITISTSTADALRRSVPGVALLGEDGLESSPDTVYYPLAVA